MQCLSNFIIFCRLIVLAYLKRDGRDSGEREQICREEVNNARLHVCVCREVLHLLKLQLWVVIVSLVHENRQMNGHDLNLKTNGIKITFL